MMHDNDDGEGHARCYKIAYGELAPGIAQVEKLKEGAKMSAETKRELTSEDQAMAHWRYIEGVLNTHLIDPDEIERVGFHYRTAFVHGWKHAEEAQYGND